MSDIFVALPPATNGCVIFGKNSDRPPHEVQEVVYIPAKKHAIDSKVQTTYIEVEQAEQTHAVILSKPSWAWGAEMGSNEHGVCIGCTSVWTKLCHPGDHEEKLLGVDLVRLALEQSSTAKEATEIIVKYLEKYGQGGATNLDRNFSQWTYDNSFLVADKSEAWVMDTAGKLWALRRISSGVHNITSALSIGSDYESSSSNLEEAADKYGCRKGDNGKVDFAATFNAEFSGISLSEAQSPANRKKRGKELLEDYSKQGKFSQENMFDILRNEDGMINFVGELLTVGSQVSVLYPVGSNVADCHWFTATPNPKFSIFKPFIFCSDVDIGTATTSPDLGCKRESFQTSVDLRHVLYKAHEKVRNLVESGSPKVKSLRSIMHTIETQCSSEIQELQQEFSESKATEVQDVFKDVVELEMMFYNKK